MFALSTLLLLMTVNAHALELADIELKDDGFTGKFEYSVDLYLVRSSGGDDFEVGTVTLTFTYNTQVLSNPVLSLEHLDFHDNGLYAAMALDNSVDGETQLQVIPTGATGTVLTGSEVRLGRITFTVDSENYTTETAGIGWVIAFTSIENISSGYTVFLSENVSLDGNTSLVCAPGPTLSGAPVTSIAAGNSYSFTPTVDDVCGAPAYGIANPPSWASFDTTTGALAGTPTLADVGTSSGVVISVTDEYGRSDDLASFNIEVTADCVAPLISGTPDTSVASGSAYSFEPTASNGCGTLAFDIVNQPLWASFDTTTGALSGTPVAADVGVYSDIVITVTDDLNTSATLAAFDIDVTDTGSSSGSSSGGDDDSISSGGGGGGGGGCFIMTVQ
jgi:uncharacterized membrane protein YgcG